MFGVVLSGPGCLRAGAASQVLQPKPLVGVPASSPHAFVPTRDRLLLRHVLVRAEAPA